MELIQGGSNADVMLRMYAAVASGMEINPREAACRNVHNLWAVFNTHRPVITDFKARKFNLQYAKQEWLWYLRADPMDDTIEKYATMWAKIKQDDGTYFSNYGQYLFRPDLENDRPSPFVYALNQLVSSPDTRRAQVMLLQPYHLFAENRDTVCTLGINFTIIQDTLHMTVNMRSNDVIYGFTNDAFCFWNLYMFMYVAVKKHIPNLKKGLYEHHSISMHVYEKHYDMIKQIIADGISGYNWPEVPEPTIEEVAAFINGKEPVDGEYSKWLTT